MIAVGVWASNALEVAHTLFPAPRASCTKGNVAVVADACQLGDTITIGDPPTASHMRLSEDGLVLERGAAWTAPIYYRVDALVASSALAPLVRETDVVDEERVAGIVGFAFRRDEPRSVYRNIRIVRPFETVLLNGAGRTSTMRKPPTLARVPRAPVEKHARELRELLVAAVTKAAAGRRVGLMLSGGLDSSSVLAALLAGRGADAREIAAVTLDFDAPGSDRPHVEALERHYGLVVSRVKPANIPASRALVIDCAPTHMASEAWVLACGVRAHEVGAEVLLTGTGGDDFFGGEMGRSVVSGLSNGDFFGAWDAARALFPYRASARHRLRAIAAAIARPHFPKALRRLRSRWMLRAAPDWAGPLLLRELEAVQRERVESRSARTPQERFEEIERSAAQSELGAIARAQTDTLASIPRSDPLYDDDLLQFLVGVPQEALFAGATYRGLLREAMRGLLPESVRTRADKSDFEPALADAVWPLERYAALLAFPRLVAAGIVEDAPFRAYLEPVLSSPRSPESGEAWLTFWSALAAEAFLQRWV